MNLVGFILKTEVFHPRGAGNGYSGFCVVFLSDQALSSCLRRDMLRRSMRRRRRTRSTCENIVVTTTTAATSAISVQDVPITIEYDNVPAEFLTQIEVIPVQVKRKRQRHEDMLNAPL